MTNFKFEIDEIVHEKCDVNQNPRMITGYFVEPGKLLYKVSLGADIFFSEDFQISKTKNFSL